jgi:O-antigen ligase
LRLIGVLFFSLVFFSIGILLAYSQGIDVKRLWSYKGAYSASYFDRIEYIKSAVNLLKENPIFGIGMGEFMYLHGGKGNYPHNLFLESLVSFGIFGILIFWPAFLFSFKNSINILRNKNLKNVEIVALWFIFFFFDSMFSGSLSDFRTLWLFMGILSILYYSYQRKLK